MAVVCQHDAVLYVEFTGNGRVRQNKTWNSVSIAERSKEHGLLVTVCQGVSNKNQNSTRKQTKGLASYTLPTNLRPFFCHVVRLFGPLNLEIMDLFVWQRKCQDNKGLGSQHEHHWLLLVRFKERIGIKEKKAARVGNATVRLDRGACTVQLSQNCRDKKEPHSRHPREDGHLSFH